MQNISIKNIIICIGMLFFIQSSLFGATRRPTTTPTKVIHVRPASADAKVSPESQEPEQTPDETEKNVTPAEQPTPIDAKIKDAEALLSLFKPLKGDSDYPNTHSELTSALESELSTDEREIKKAALKWLQSFNNVNCISLKDVAANNYNTLLAINLALSTKSSMENVSWFKDLTPASFYYYTKKIRYQLFHLFNSTKNNETDAAALLAASSFRYLCESITNVLIANKNNNSNEYKEYEVKLFKNLQDSYLRGLNYEAFIQNNSDIQSEIRRQTKINPSVIEISFGDRRKQFNNTAEFANFIKDTLRFGNIKTHTTNDLIRDITRLRFSFLAYKDWFETLRDEIKRGNPEGIRFLIDLGIHVLEIQNTLEKHTTGKSGLRSFFSPALVSILNSETLHDPSNNDLPKTTLREFSGDNASPLNGFEGLLLSIIQINNNTVTIFEANKKMMQKITLCVLGTVAISTATSAAAFIPAIGPAIPPVASAIAALAISSTIGTISSLAANQISPTNVVLGDSKLDKEKLEKEIKQAKDKLLPLTSLIIGKLPKSDELAKKQTKIELLISNIINRTTSLTASITPKKVLPKTLERLTTTQESSQESQDIILIKKLAKIIENHEERIRKLEEKPALK